MDHRCILVVLDSVGAGALPDAAEYGDEGADTLGNVCAVAEPRLPNFERLGLGNIRSLAGVRTVRRPIASFGKMAERSAGKDSTTGHWELAGVVLDEPFRTFPEGFPAELLNELGVEVLGNEMASGTEIIQRLGPEHERTGRPILYTSADPVLQIAAHEEIVPVESLYELCETAFEVATTHGINRVIARPFEGEHPKYRRTERRRDFTLPPPAPTVLDAMQERAIPVLAIGKVSQLFSGRGITEAVTTKSNLQGVDATLSALAEWPEGLIFTNLLDFDMLYGHRRNVEGYSRALEEFDHRLPDLVEALSPGDLFIVTADHGNDPTFRGTDHTREYAPLLVIEPSFGVGRDLGTRETFADVAATLAEWLGFPWRGPGRAFSRTGRSG